MVNLKLPNLSTAPPGQWRYTVPETGQSFGPEPDLDSLITKIRAHYSANGYPNPSNLLPLIEQHICSQHPDYCVHPDGTASGLPSLPPTPGVTLAKALRVTFHTVSKGTQRLLGIQNNVSQEQADHRASVCITCPENVSREDCAGCRLNMLRDIVVKIIGTRKTPFDSQLKVCRVCLCENRAKVHLPLADINRLTTPEERAQLPSHCWQLTEQTV